MVHRARSEGRLEELLAAADEAAEAQDASQWGGDLARALLDLVVAAESRDDDPETALRALLARTRTHVDALETPPDVATGGARDRDPGARRRLNLSIDILAPTGRDGSSTDGRNSPWQL